MADDRHITELAEQFRLMADPSRLSIILSCLHRPVAVGAIAARLGLSPSLVSHHLRLLRAARVVRAERHGRQIFYVAADEHIVRVLTDMTQHVAEPSADAAATVKAVA